MSDTIEIPESHVHTPGYPEHEHDGMETNYTSPTMTRDDLAMFDQERHDQDIADQAERDRRAQLLGPADVGELALAALTEHEGSVVQLDTPVHEGGASFRVTHPRLAQPVRVDVYHEK